MLGQKLFRVICGQWVKVNNLTFVHNYPLNLQNLNKNFIKTWTWQCIEKSHSRFGCTNPYIYYTHCEICLKVILIFFSAITLLLLQAMHMFVARFCDQLDVQIKCDGCGTMLPGQRYRCLVCEDMDFCYPCYIGRYKNILSMLTYAHQYVCSHSEYKRSPPPSNHGFSFKSSNFVILCLKSSTFGLSLYILYIMGIYKWHW